MLQPSVDVIVLNYNGKKFLDECFNSLLKDGYENKNIYLLDNASPDDDVAYTKQNFPQVKIIQNPLNNGYCAAYNLAINQTSGDYIVCLNNDVKVHKNWLTHMVAKAESDKNIAALQPKLVSYFDEKKFEYAGSSGGMIDKYGYPFLRGRLFDTMEEDNGQYNDEKEIFWASGAAIFVRRSILNEVGLLDEIIVHHVDEIDWCWRMLLGGYKIAVVPKAVVAHIGGATIAPDSFKKMYWNHRNSLYMMLKNYNFKNTLRYTFVHILLDYVAAFQSLLSFKTTRSKAVLAAHWWNLTHLSTILKNRKDVKRRRKISDKELLKKMYNGSVVYEYFFKKRKTYNELKHIKK